MRMLIAKNKVLYKYIPNRIYSFIIYLFTITTYTSYNFEVYENNMSINP